MCSDTPLTVARCLLLQLFDTLAEALNRAVLHRDLQSHGAVKTAAQRLFQQVVEGDHRAFRFGQIRRRLLSG